MSDVIQFPDRTRGPTELRQAQIENKFEIFLSNEPRLPKDVPPILARKLGEWSAHVQPERGRDGAMSLFRDAFGDLWEDKWRKRKRLLRLPDEQCPPFLSGGDYESSGRHYLALAKSYAKLMGPKCPFRSEDVAQVLLEGTSLNPSPDRPSGQISERQVLLDVIQKIENLVVSTDIMEAYKIMSITRLDVEGDNVVLGPGEIPTIDVENIGNAIWEWGDCTGYDTYPWWFPTVVIGRIYIPLSFAAKIVRERDEPEKFAEISNLLAKQNTPTGSGAELNQYLQSFIDSSWKFITDQSDCVRGDVLESSFYSAWDLTAFLGPNSKQSNPSLNFALCAPGYGQINSPYRAGVLDACSIYMKNNGKFCDINEAGVFFDEFLVNSRKGVHYIGPGYESMQRQCMDFIYSEPSLSGRIISALSSTYKAGCVFIPDLWADDTRVVPARHGSAAACLMQNAAFSPAGESLAERFKAQIETRCQLILDRFRTDVSAYEAALSERGNQ